MRRSPTSKSAPWLVVCVAFVGALWPATGATQGDRVSIEGGTFTPFFADTQSATIEVSPFALDRTPVTNAEYADFVEAVPRWAPGAPPALFAGPGYLARWNGRDPAAVRDDAALRDQPVTGVSFFAAQAYCTWTGGRLPIEAEWELVAQASASARDASDDPQHIRRVLSWYERPSPQQLADVGLGDPNAWGIHDMHGLVWEWVADFNASMVGGARRGASERLLGFFCGGAAVEARSPSDYAAFLRYAFRSSLSGDYTSSSLGFRCAYDTENPS